MGIYTSDWTEKKGAHEGTVSSVYSSLGAPTSVAGATGATIPDSITPKQYRGLKRLEKDIERGDETRAQQMFEHFSEDLATIAMGHDGNVMEEELQALLDKYQSLSEDDILSDKVRSSVLKSLEGAVEKQKRQNHSSNGLARHETLLEHSGEDGPQIKDAKDGDRKESIASIHLNPASKNAFHSSERKKMKLQARRNFAKLKQIRTRETELHQVKIAVSKSRKACDPRRKMLGSLKAIVEQAETINANR